MNVEDYANMTPEDRAYYEGKAEGKAEIDRLKKESDRLEDMEKYKEFYHASVAEHRKSIEMIDSLESQIEVLRPVYEAAKVWQGAVYFGKHGNMDAASDALKSAIKIAARELEDSDE